MSRYTSATETDRQEMLAAIGVESIDDLFADVPEGVRLGRPLDLPPGKPEQEVYAHLRDLAAKNTSAEDEMTFLGAGMYDHYVPALIDSILRGRSSSPLHALPARDQPGRAAGDVRVPDGDLRADGPAGLQRLRLRGPERRRRRRLARAHAHASKTRFLVSEGLHPHSPRDARDDLRRLGDDDRDDRRSTNGLTNCGDVGDDVAAIFVGQPNFYGAIEDLEALSARQGRRAADRRRPTR